MDRRQGNRDWRDKHGPKAAVIVSVVWVAAIAIFLGSNIDDWHGDWYGFLHQPRWHFDVYLMLCLCSYYLGVRHGRLHTIQQYKSHYRQNFERAWEDFKARKRKEWDRFGRNTGEGKDTVN